MNVKINWDEGVFAVPNRVTDGLKLASTKSLRLLLYYLKNRRFPDDPANIGAGADDIEDAVNYWQQMGVFIKDDLGNSATSSSTEDKPDQSQGFSPLPQQKYDNSKIAERIKKSPDVAFMFTTAESELKRMLTFDDQRTLLWIHDHLGMSTDVVTMITAFCCRHGWTSMARIEKIAIEMFEKDVVTHESVNRELAAIEMRSSYEDRLKLRLGIQTGLTPRQREYIEDWCNKNISVELVQKAYYITMEAKGKTDFRYMGGAY